MVSPERSGFAAIQLTPAPHIGLGWGWVWLGSPNGVCPLQFQTKCIYHLEDRLGSNRPWGSKPGRIESGSKSGNQWTITYCNPGAGTLVCFQTSSSAPPRPPSPCRSHGSDGGSSALVGRLLVHGTLPPLEAGRTSEDELPSHTSVHFH